MNEITKSLERRHDIDWLRVLAMLTVFLFHCARFFNDEGWQVKNFETSYGMTVFVAVLTQWIMPIFFVLSGISSYYALSYLTVGRYVNARIKRLVVPLLLGIFTHIPIQVYCERVSHGQFDGSFIIFYPHYFDGFYAFGGNFAWMGLHLWYLEMLFIFSLITLPLFIWMKKETGRNMISRCCSFFEKRGAIFLLAIPILVMEWLVNLQPETVGRRDWGGWSIFTHLVFFLVGCAIASDLRIGKALEKHWTISLMGVLLTTVAGYFLLEAGVSSRGFFFSILRSFNAWFWLAAILGFGGKSLRFKNSALEYASEAVLPFYIFHQTVIVVIGFFIADWRIGIAPKYIFLCVSSFVAIMALYEMLVRRINIMRLLFGLKPRKVRDSSTRLSSLPA